MEAAAINKSLSALGQVFQAISKGAPHVPFRNSKLTHVLQDSLGGDSKTCMFINVRPDDDNLSVACLVCVHACAVPAMFRS